MTEPAKLLVVTTGLTGILNASFELTRRLQGAGHEVVLAAPRPVGERVAAQGFSFVELPAIDVVPVPQPAGSNGLTRMWGRFRDRQQRRAQGLDNYRPRAFEEVLRSVDPDLVLLDIELHEYIFATHGSGRPFALLSQWYSTWRRPGLPYALTDTIPGVGEDGTPEAIAAHWDAVARQRKRMFTKMRWLSFGTDRRSTLLRLADEYGFPRRYLRKNWWPGVFSYAELPAITMTPREVEFDHDVRPRLHYIGPMVYEDRVESDATSHRGEKIEEVIKRARSAGSKILVVTVSTLSAGDGHFLQRLFAAVNGIGEWQVLVGLGGIMDSKSLGSVPENVHTFDYLPQLRVLRAADLSINHAGIHTIHECIHFGVPQLVYSGKQSDQPGCAARVHHAGIGLRADKDTDTAEEIRENIRRVLTEDTFRQQTEELRKACLSYRTEWVLERTVNQLLTTVEL